MEQKERLYPVGIQTFSEIIRNNLVYVDKTDLMWRMQRMSKFIFLSRPRRFGKSLLSSTLHSFFDGDRELFEGLKVMALEKEWKRYPVLHFDLSTAKNTDLEGVKSVIGLQLEKLEDIYGKNTSETSLGMRFSGIIYRAYRRTGSQVVVIIDEYDAPMLDVLHDDDRLKATRTVMQEFYQHLKMNEPMIRFCFITGITKFSQLSIFSILNNLTNISMLPEFSAICGITEEELTTVLQEDIAFMSDRNGLTAEEMHVRLKNMYDGYHFSEDSPDVYNPYSLLKAFLMKKIGNYWFDSGTPTFLIRQLQLFRTDITSLDTLEAPAMAFDRPTEAMTSALPLLYQAGYLTIKGYDAESEMYSLSLPNKEVRVGYVDGLLPVYAGLEGGDVQSGFALRFWRALKSGDTSLALEEMRSYLASLPYVEGFRRKLEAAAASEGFYEYTLYLIFSMLNVYVRTQVKCVRGRIDMVVRMPSALYVFELKVNGTAQEALRQIATNGYAIPYEAGGRRVVRVGVRFSSETRTIEEWLVEE